MLTNMAIMFAKRYGDVISYMPQNVNVINSDDMTILDYFGLNVPKEIIENHREALIEVALELAADLNISDTWFNKKSILKPLDRTPSGGEEKRLALIQTILLLFLQIKLGLEHKKLLLVDEATSGLDKENFDLVRENIFKRLVAHGIIMVYIDHHENDDSDIVLVDITKEEVSPISRLPLIQERLVSVWTSLAEIIISFNSDDDNREHYESLDVVYRPNVVAKIRT